MGRLSGKKDDFDKKKEKYLSALKSDLKDRSKKGHVDEQILPLLDAINRSKDFYTTSSCAGRIDLFVEPESGKKHEGKWLFVSHEEVNHKELERLLAPEELLLKNPKGTLWFRMEGAILHVCCRDMDAANRFLQACKETGWKHSGITGTRGRIMIEATTSERMDVPIAKDAALFVPMKFIAFLVKEANEKLGKTREKMERLTNSLSKRQTPSNKSLS
jgi:tRNA wybutosine-synthesizing protein 3